ncbi:hypothetical protein O6H91_15G022700 [Diphasiastrum complanatum]|uniref:Uncharacterized protein n=1 Tax=Diphasiastrum complanatum TaxID=34168 RepID=A0ACC2BGL5_DIPCM|nr:hypothetical protein O6H91_15G022700 [Diphasiastrum complanatum]
MVVMASSSVVAVSLNWKASMETAATPPLDALLFDTSHCQACLSVKLLPFDSFSLKGRYAKHQSVYESSHKRIIRAANSRRKSGNGKLTSATPRKQLSGGPQWKSTELQERHEEVSMDSRVAGTGNVKKMQGEERIPEKLARESDSKLTLIKSSEENQQMRLNHSFLAEERYITDTIQNDVPGEELEKSTFTIDATEKDAPSEEVETSTVTIDVTENDAPSEDVETSSVTIFATERDISKEEVDGTRQSHLAVLENMKKQPDVEEALAQKREKEVFLEEEVLRLAQIEAQKLDLLKLVEANSFAGNKVFFYPQTVRAGSEVQIFLNRSTTVLVNQPRIIIMGAFNDWRWIPFSVGMQKSDLPGDWWVCSVQVPREAYKIDFVFFNGENIYENNATNDFFVLVEGGMMKGEFEDFLIEEKRKEAERLAAEQAEKERIAAEEHKRAEIKAAEEADKAEAVRIVKEQREREQLFIRKAVKNMEGVWKFEPSNFCAGGTVNIFYCRSSGPLAFSKEIWIHGGYNNWQDSVSIVKKLSPAQSKVGDWWSVEVYVQESAYMLNWVFADGPPNSAKLYDNNNYQDFHGLVPRSMLEDLYWAIVEDEVYKNLRLKRQEQEKAEKKKAEHRERINLEMKAKSKQAFLKSQAHVFYTDPVDVRAGEKVDVFYNPSSTILKGKAEVWMRYSFNCWTHRLGVLPPLKMIATGHGTHLKACVPVPQDAYVMDFVFSERGDVEGGIYDNRNGLDYHIPINGSAIKEPPLNVVHVAVEMAPIAKVGGLGDVVTSLSRAVQELGHNVEVLLPKYDCLDYKYGTKKEDD